MTEPVRPLEALIAKWRESAQWESESNLQYAQALDQCAEELEAVAATTEKAMNSRAEALWEELGGDLCICQRAEVMHWCENCQRKIALIDSALLQAAAPPAPIAEPDMRALHIAFTVAIRRTGGRLVACDGPDCRICAFVSASRKAAAPPERVSEGKENDEPSR